VQPFQAACTRLVDEHEAAAILGLSVKTLRRWRWAGREVPFIKLGGAVRYDLADLQACIDAHRCGSTSMAA
jgi:predicted site-specific integrase-resolvase